MDVFCTSKNSGPSYVSDSTYMLYLGTSLEEAIAAVGTFVKYERPITERDRKLSVLTYLMPREPIKYYMADGWWCSIVKIQLFESER